MKNNFLTEPDCRYFNKVSSISSTPLLMSMLSSPEHSVSGVMVGAVKLTESKTHLGEGLLGLCMGECPHCTD